MKKEEVRYHLLRPAEIVERRKKRPVAYVPIGNIEWHGPHLPTGTDTLQSENMANLCALKGGGLAFPPLYFGEPRLTELMEGNDPEISGEMDLPFDNFSDHSLYPCDAWEEARHYQLLLSRILAQIESLGFELTVIVVGHYPLIDHARAAALEYNHRPVNENRPKTERMLAWCCVDYLLVKDQYGKVAGDHAGGWETSHILASHPDCVDLSVLPPKGRKIIGTGGEMDPREANAQFGEETMSAAVEICLAEVKLRLDPKTRQNYRSHGGSLQEGRWRKDCNNMEGD